MMSTVKIYKQFMASRLLIIFMKKKKKPSQKPRAFVMSKNKEFQNCYHFFQKLESKKRDPLISLLEFNKGVKKGKLSALKKKNDHDRKAMSYSAS